MNEAEGRAIREHVAKALKTQSVNSLHKLLGVGNEQIVRIAAGLPVRKGTLLVVRENLPLLLSGGGPATVAR